MQPERRYIKSQNIHEDRNSQNQEKYRAIIKKRKRKIILNRIILTILFVAAVGTGWTIARVETQVKAVMNTMNRDMGIDLSSVDIDQTSLSSHDKVINILLIGSDKRIDWTQTGRSDSTMIATLDLKNKRLKLTSIMRDMYVSIPSYGENRFNAAYSFGGVSLLYQTIASNFGLKLDGYIVVDFNAFKTVINMIGGVEIELTEKEHKYLTTAYKKGSVLELKDGLNNMNGTQALAYTRIRQDADGDFGRTQRQRKVLQGIFIKAKSMSFTNIIKLAESIMPYIATDLTDDEMTSYMKSIILLGTTTIDQKRIPVDNSYTQDRIRNMAVLVPDMDINIKELNEFIFEYAGEN